MKRKADGNVNGPTEKKSKLTTTIPPRLSHYNECVCNELRCKFSSDVTRIITGYASYIEGTFMQSRQFDHMGQDVDLHGDYIYTLDGEDLGYCLQSRRLSDGILTRKIHLNPPSKTIHMSCTLLACDSLHLCIVAANSILSDSILFVTLIDRRDFEEGKVETECVEWTSVSFVPHEEVFSLCLSPGRVNFLVQNHRRNVCYVEYVLRTDLPTLCRRCVLAAVETRHADVIDFWVDTDQSVIFTQGEGERIDDWPLLCRSSCQVISHGNQRFEVLKSGDGEPRVAVFMHGVYSRFNDLRPPPAHDAAACDDWQPDGMRCIERGGINELVVWDRSTVGKTIFSVFQ